jgi:hypothetical protein
MDLPEKPLPGHEVPAPRAEEPLLVVGLAEVPAPHEPQIWKLLDLVMPRVKNLCALNMGNLREPEALKIRALSRRLGSLMASRQRVALLGGADGHSEPQRISHWHHRTLEKALPSGPSASRSAGSLPGLSALRRRLVFERRDLGHLPYWLEDELPACGLDFIGVDVAPRDDPGHLVLPHDEELKKTAAAVSTILWEIIKDNSSIARPAASLPAEDRVPKISDAPGDDPAGEEVA